MYTGLLSSGMLALPSAPYSCPTGNCTWDPFPSLGIGIQCINMSNYYTLDCSIGDFFDVGKAFKDACSIQATPALNASGFQTGANGRWIINTVEPKVSVTTIFFLSSSFIPYIDLLPNTWAAKPTNSLTEISWARAKALDVALSDASLPTPYINKNSEFESEMCILYTELQEISAKVENGIYTEKILQRQTRADNAEMFDGPSDNAWKDRNKPNITYSYRPSCNAYSSVASCNETNVTLSLHYMSQYCLLSGMDSLFVDFRYIEEVGVGNVSTGFGNTLYGPEVLKMMYQTPNISKSLQNLAHYMTVALRANDTALALQSNLNDSTGLPKDYIAPSHRVSGYAYRDQVHVRVRWGWLALPALLVILVALLLIGTVRATHKHQVSIWKENPLALLVHTQWRPDHSIMIQGSTSADIGRSVDGLKVRVVGNRVWIGENECGDG